MAVLVGIDEAGYGPILGPLVMSAAAVEMPGELIDVPLWDVLRQSVSRTVGGSAGRIAIADSKKLKASGNYDRLQRGVLAVLACMDGGAAPDDLPGLLERLECDILDQLAEYPWYGLTVPDWQLSFDADDIVTAGRSLSRELQEQRLCLRALWSRPLPAGRFNRMVEASGNKATVSFSLAADLIDRAYREFGKASSDQVQLQILVDKQGGRTHYRTNLQRLFPHHQMKILKESDTTSSYELAEPGGAMRIHFLAKGEDRQLPIALASMTSKYLRELFMEILNVYFQRHCPGIAPTAGYYQDGKRFLRDLEAAQIDRRLAPAELLVRCK